MTKFTFVSGKALRDSSGKLYVIFQGSLQNKVVSIEESTRSFVASRIETKTTPSGEQQVFNAYSKVPNSITSLTFNIELEDRSSVSVKLTIPNADQKLPESYDLLSQSLVVTSDGTTNTHSVVDAVYYSKSKYKQLYIFPESSSRYLDTSSKQDYYYVSDGAAAYLGSNELQNSFLNELGHKQGGYNPLQLGKFRGGDNNAEIRYSCYSDKERRGPKVCGVIKVVESNVLKSASQVTVCTNPASSNYYLTGCEGETWPCVPVNQDLSGLANDCDGNALTLDAINNFIVVDGGCCLTCDGYLIDVVHTEATTSSSANGSIVVNLTGGTFAGGSAAYVLTAIQLEVGPITGYSTDGTHTATIGDGITSVTISSMPAGLYELTVTDDAGCNLTKQILLGFVAEGQDEGWGCGPSGSSAAINYESGIAAAYETDALCVYCNATSGLLETGTESAATTPILSTALGAWAEMEVSTSPASVNPTSGAALSNGFANVAQLEFPTYQLIGPNQATWNEFSAGQWFSGSADASPYEYILYKIPLTLEIGSQADGDNVKTNITGAAIGSSPISTSTNASGGLLSLSGLAHGRYAIILSYTNGSATKEYEECYAVKEFKIGLKGCDQPGAVNYNADVNIPADDCITPECNPSAFNTPFAIEPTLCGVTVLENDWLGNNPEIFAVYNNGYESIGTSGLPSGPLGPGALAAAVYIFENIFCGLSPIFYPGIAAAALGGADDNSTYSTAPNYTPTASNGVTLPIWVNFEEGTFDYEDFGATAQLNNTITGLSLICPFFRIKFADGEQFIITQTAEGFIGGPYTFGLSNLLFSDSEVIVDENGVLQTGDRTPLMSVPCGYILEHGDITEVETVIAYGEPGVWGSVYQSVWSNSGDGYFNTVEHCQNVDCSGDVTTIITGCTDPEATNYNPDANTEDGSCQYPPPPEIPGCTDPAATNYDANANLDDGTCEYITLDILGCTDMQAANFNPAATIEDGSCIYDGSGTLDDCSTIHDFANSNVHYIMNNQVITNTASTYSETTGLCIPDNTGSVVVNLPSVSGLTIQNPNGLYAAVILTWLSPPLLPPYFGQTQMQSNFAPGFVSAVDFVTTWGQDTTTINASDLLDPDTTTSFTFSNLPNGAYVVQVIYTAAALETGGVVTVNSPGWSTASQGAGILNAFCPGSIQAPVTIGMNVCEGLPETQVYGCTDPDADNYNSLATVDDGTCTYPCNPCEGECLCPDGSYSVDCCVPDPVSGCTDPNALNFNASANMEDGSCHYPPCPINCVDFVSAVCIPNRINAVIGDVERCLANVGNRFYTKLISGLSDDCSTMEAWKIIIISELLSKKGLPCIYNCADSETPDSPGSRCEDKWESSGSLYWNPSDTAVYTVGTVVKHHDIIYQAVTTIGLNLDPSTTVSFPDNPISGWQKCVDAVTYSDTTNYLQKFTSFAQKYCRECGIPPYITEAMESIQTTNPLTIGGAPIENDGSSFTSDDT